MASSPASSTSSSTRTDLDISTIRSIILAALAMYPQLQFDVIEPLRPTPLDGLSDIALHTALEQIKIKHPHVASTIEKKRQEFQTYAADDLSWVETETRDVLRQFAHFPPERHAEVGWRLTTDLYKIVDRILDPIHGHTNSSHKISAVHALVSMGNMILSTKPSPKQALTQFDQNVLFRLSSSIKSITSVMTPNEQDAVIGAIVPLDDRCASYGFTGLSGLVRSLQPPTLTQSTPVVPPVSAYTASMSTRPPYIDFINVLPNNQVLTSAPLLSPVSPYASTPLTHDWQSQLAASAVSTNYTPPVTPQQSSTLSPISPVQESWQPGSFYSPHACGPGYRPRGLSIADERNALSR